MWLFTPTGFISVVADKNDPNNERLLVRSRKRNHISSVFPQADIFSKTPSDYQWRAWVLREDVIEVMEKLVKSLNYTNFKNAIPDDHYHDACTGVWDVMYRSYSHR
jgi:hypothetical protein